MDCRFRSDGRDQSLALRHMRQFLSQVVEQFTNDEAVGLCYYRSDQLASVRAE